MRLQVIDEFYIGTKHIWYSYWKISKVSQYPQFLWLLDFGNLKFVDCIPNNNWCAMVCNQDTGKFLICNFHSQPMIVLGHPLDLAHRIAKMQKNKNMFNCIFQSYKIHAVWTDRFGRTMASPRQSSLENKTAQKSCLFSYLWHFDHQAWHEFDNTNKISAFANILLQNQDLLASWDCKLLMDFTLAPNTSDILVEKS